MQRVLAVGAENLLGQLMVHRRQRAEVGDQPVEHPGLRREGVLGDRGPLAEDDPLCHLRVLVQHPPVHVATVPKIRVVALVGGRLEDAGDEVSRRLRALQAELHRRREHLQLHVRRLVQEVLREALQQLDAVVNPVGVLTDDPDHGGLGLGLVQVLQVLAEVGDDRLVLPRISPENVPDDDQGLLHDVAHLRADQLQQGVDATLRGAAELDGALADRADRPSDALDVDLGGVLAELGQDLVHRLFRGELDHHGDLLQLHVQGVVVLAHEHADLPLQDLRLLLHDQIDVPHHDILDLRLRREERHERRRHLLAQRPDELGARDPVHELHHHLDCGEHHGAVRMREPDHHSSLEDRLRDARGRRVEHRDGVQEEHLAPLRALVQRGKQLGDDILAQLQVVLPRRGRDLAQGGHGVRDHHWVRVAQHVPQDVDEPLVLDELSVDVEELRDADRGRLSHVRVLVLATTPQRLQKILGHLLQPDAPHGANGQRS
mmetsp:Transcript_93534/g.261644  ORF Transcript_93534/g.261644 Transcript_93534/m.261644 type:complete len:489 (+) Transcript_93534:1040-2506(+)